MSQNRESTGGDALFGHAVERALAELEPDLGPLRVASALRRALPPEVARRAAELHALRQRARRRFPDGRLAFLTAKGLEQASRPEVARARAARLRAAGVSTAWDATCGVGSDALALADSGATVLASDRDALHARCAAANLERAGGPCAVFVADALRPPFGRAVEAALLDPDRRAHGERSLDPRRWSPTLAEALRTACRFPAAVIKLAPAFDPARQRPAPSVPHVWQWVSSRGELAELALWTGSAAGGGSGGREVLAIGDDGRETRLQGPPVEIEASSDDEAARVAWLAEPDPAVIRAGLVGRLAEQLGLRPIAPRIAYLAGPRPPSSALVRAWRVVATSPLDPRRVRAMLGAHDVGPIEVRKRGHPDPAEVLARRLRGPGARRGHLAVTRLRRGHLALLLEPSDEGKRERVGDEGFEPPTSSL